MRDFGSNDCSCSTNNGFYHKWVLLPCETLPSLNIERRCLYEPNEMTVSFSATTSALRWNSTGSCVAGQTSGVPGPAANQLQHPYALSFNSNMSLYIVDSENNRIQQWSSGATTCITVAGQANGTTGVSLSTLNFPVGIAIDSADNLYLTDRHNHQVMYWPKGALSGTIIAGTTGEISIVYLKYALLSAPSEVLSWVRGEKKSLR